MIVEEILPLDYAGAADTARLAAQQTREVNARNTAAWERWHICEFGPIVGPQVARGYNVMMGAAQAGLDQVLVNSKRTRSPDAGSK